MANILAVAGPGSRYSIPGAKPAGFWAGLWHGLICPITFIERSGFSRSIIGVGGTTSVSSSGSHDPIGVLSRCCSRGRHVGHRRRSA